MKNYPVKWITNQLAVGYAPSSHADLETISDHGISAIVNLCAECYDLNEIEANKGFDVKFVPIPDQESPDAESLEEALNWLDSQLSMGKKVLVHCRFGIGRTGTFVIAHLIRSGDNLKSALKKMKHTPSAPTSRNQLEFLNQYIKKVGVSKEGLQELEMKIRKPTDLFFGKWEAIVDWFK